MSDKPFVPLLHQNDREAGRLRHELALAVAHEIVEANGHQRRGIDDPELLFPKLDLVAGADPP
jgi:hypothetical protein